MKIQSGISFSPELQRLISKTPQAGGAESANFGSMLSEKIKEVDQLQKSADQSAIDFSTGKSRNLHEAILAMEMADTSLRMAINVRNKVIEAYQEIMRIPV